jgi:hypothetical protein
MYVGVSIIAIKTACLDEGVDLLGQLVSPSDQMMIERTSHDVRCLVSDAFDASSVVDELKLKPKQQEWEEAEDGGNSEKHDTIPGHVHSG